MTGVRFICNSSFLYIKKVLNVDLVFMQAINCIIPNKIITNGYVQLSSREFFDMLLSKTKISPLLTRLRLILLFNLMLSLPHVSGRN